MLRNFLELIKIHNLDKRKFVLLLVTVITLASAQQRVDVIPNVLEVRDGESVEFLCRVASPIRLCRIEIPGHRPFNLFSETEQPDGIRGNYVGNGFQRGECGFKLERIDREFNGEIKCSLTISNDEYTGVIPVSVTTAPNPPEIDLRGQAFFESNTRMNVSCSSRDGRPAAGISWFLNGQELSKNSQDVVYRSTGLDNQTLFTVESELVRFVQADDDGKDLVCRATHKGFPEPGYSETKTIIQVHYPPMALPEQRIAGLVLGSTAFVTVPIKANPAPRIKWIIAGKVYEQGQQVDRFIVSEPRFIANNTYNITLTIGGLTLEDTTKSYVVKASNEFGVQDYRVRISSSSEILDEGGLGVPAILGIIIGAILIVVALTGVIIAKITRKWCFAGNEFRTSEGPDSEAQIHDEKDEKHEQYDQPPESEPVEEATNNGMNGKKAVAKEANGNTQV